MTWAKSVAAVFLTVCVGAIIWGIAVPRSAEDVGVPLANPQYLFGCYSDGKSEIRLTKNYADFGGTRVPVSYGLRKTLREVIYPSTFPWIANGGTFVFNNDRFDLLDISKDNEGRWTIEMWDAEYLATRNADRLGTVLFRKHPCSRA